MSKVSITIDMDEMVCTTLQYMRKAHETRDYSQLPALIERVQQHVNAMEEGLYRGSNFRHRASTVVYGDKSNKEKLKAIKELLEDYK